MTLYIVIHIFCLFVFFVGFSKKTPQNIYSPLVLLVMLILCGLPAFRGEFSSADTPNYISYYLNPQLGYNDSQFIEYGCQYLFRFIHYLFEDNWYCFITITSLLSTVPLMILIGKQSPIPSLSLLLFLIIGPSGIIYVFYFGIIRQCLSVGILCYLVYSLATNKYKNRIIYYIIFVLSLFFHRSSFVFFPVLFFHKINLSSKIVVFATIISLIIGYSNINSFLLQVSGDMDKSFYFTHTDNSMVVKFSKLIPTLFIALYMYFYSPKEDRNSLWMKITLSVMIFVNILTFNVANNMERMVFPYFIFLVISIPIFIANKKIPIYKRIVFLTSILIYYSTKYYIVLSQQFIFHEIIGSPVPYESYF